MKSTIASHSVINIIQLVEHDTKKSVYENSYIDLIGSTVEETDGVTVFSLLTNSLLNPTSDLRYVLSS